MTFSLLNFPGIKGPPQEDLTVCLRNLAIKPPVCSEFGKSKMMSSLKFNLILVLSLSTMHLFWCYPVLSSKESGKSDYCLILLNRCLARLDGSEELAFLKPILEKTSMKRSFRNGVGTGIKKTSFRRAKP